MHDTRSQSHSQLTAVDNDAASTLSGLRRFSHIDLVSTCKQRIQLEDDLVLTVRSFRTVPWKLALYVFLCIVSGGLFYAVCRWFPRLKRSMIASVSSLHHANVLEITDSWGNVDLVSVEKEHIGSHLEHLLKSLSGHETGYVSNELSSFTHRCTKFVFDPVSMIFIDFTHWFDANWKHSNGRNGLQEDEAKQRLQFFGANDIVVERKGLFQLFLEEFVHPFYFFQLFSVTLWLIQGYTYYAIVIIVITTSTLAFTLYSTRKNLARLSQMARFTCSLNVFRDGKWQAMSSENIVPGDIFEITNDVKTLPCDAMLLTGDCITNESMLTGESFPVSKLPMSDDEFSTFSMSQLSHRSKSVLFGGTNLVRVRSSNSKTSKAMVIRTGFTSLKGTLIRSILFPKPNKFKFYQDSIKFICVLAFLAFGLFLYNLVNFTRQGLPARFIALKSLDLMTIVIPPALPAIMLVGTFIAIDRLKKKMIYCIAPPRVNISGKLNVMVFDKTGTLTEDNLDIYGVKESVNETFGELVQESNQLGTASLNEKPTMKLCMGACHSLKSIDDKLVGDPLDVKMFEFSSMQMEEVANSDMIAYVKDASNVFELRKCFEFDSSLKRMSVIVKSPSGLFFALAKGAPEIIRSISRSETIPNNFDTVLDELSQSGYRVIACAGKVLADANQKRDVTESGLEFLGFLVFENKLKPQTAPVLQVLKDANIRHVMSTGDNLLTAVSVARECSLIRPGATIYVPRFLKSSPDGKDQIEWSSIESPELKLDAVALATPMHRQTRNVSESSLAEKLGFSSKLLPTPQSIEFDPSYTLALTGDVFDHVLKHYPQSTVERMLVQTSVFARMSPEQKYELVERLQSIGYCVCMCGDGANDCSALKTADVGISLSEAEASVAAPFTSRTNTIECVLEVIREGRAALVTSFVNFKYMGLYALTQSTTVAIMYLIKSGLGDLQFLYIDLGLNMPLAFCLSYAQASVSIAKRQPTSSLISKSVIFSVVGQVLLQFFAQLFVFLHVQTQPWFKAFDPQTDEEFGGASNHWNTVVFLTSIFLYINVAISLNIGKPFRKSAYTNIPFVFVVAATYIGSLLLLFVPSESVMANLELVDIPMSYKWVIFGTAIVHLIASEVCEAFLFPFFCYMIDVTRRSMTSMTPSEVARKRGRVYESVQLELSHQF